MFILQGIERNGWRRFVEGNLSERHYSNIRRMFFGAISSVQLLADCDSHLNFSLKPLERTDELSAVY
jgi:hypothetical protein